MLPESVERPDGNGALKIIDSLAEASIYWDQKILFNQWLPERAQEAPPPFVYCYQMFQDHIAMQTRLNSASSVAADRTFSLSNTQIN